MSLSPASAAHVSACNPLLSLVICCFSSARWPHLVDAVDSALTQAGPADEVIVVVDHNDELHAALHQAFHNRIVLATNTDERGLSGARNSGVALCRNDIVVFLDDDATLRAGALEAARRAFTDDTVVSIGGAVDAQWQRGAPPRWFPREFGWVVGCDYRGLPADGASIRNPIGAAMAVRRSALLRIEGFSTRLGRVGDLPSGCEETLMGVRLQQAFPDRRIVRRTGFRVTHHVGDQRATPGYFARRCYQEGRSKAALARMSGAGPALASERGYTATVLTSGLWRARRTPGRALALVLGFTLTAMGFATGLLRPTPRGSRTPGKEHRR
ncbi:glycosyltransferase family 2 protein [Mycolicibacterium palauense]|uniref:glycosyltransferase family 2 protein n=1 Tax=Mycolicibacterium palauense TaxID=2034511 RepID=UPI001FE9A8E6|nr:glycosyltransferase family 2 protein [Mycolicibacterium palauense]